MGEDSEPAFPPHRALLIHFENSHLDNAIVAFGASMEKMGWEVFRQELDSTDSKQAQEDLQEAVEFLIQGIDDPEQGLVVFYGGYGLEVPREQVVLPKNGHPPIYKEWRWHAHSLDGPICAHHAVTVDPEPMLRQLSSRTSNDILFIFNSPAELLHTYFTTWTRQPKLGRNVQILLLRENWSMPIDTLPLGSCSRSTEGKICWNHTLQIPTGFVETPVGELGVALGKLADRLWVDEGYSFLRAYMKIRTIGRREPEIVPVMGKAQKHYLTRGWNLVDDDDEGSSLLKRQ